MGFFDSKSNAYTTSSTEIEDSRVTGVENSQVASGGGSSTYREVIPEAPLTAVIEALSQADERRSYEALRSAELASQGQAAAVAGLVAQRQTETEPVGAALERLAPAVALGLLALVLLTRR